MLRERTKNGLEAARKDGRVGSRRPKLTLRQQQEIVKLVHSGQKNAADAARLFNVHPLDYWPSASHRKWRCRSAAQKLPCVDQRSRCLVDVVC